MLRTTGAVAATVLVLAAVPAISATADGTHRGGKPKVTLKVPAAVVEGDQFTVVVKVGRVDGAKQVRLEQYVAASAGGHTWQLVGKANAKHKKTYKFKAVGGEEDTVSFRARVVYRDGKPAKSKPSASTVWHWTSLGSFDSYSSTNGVNDSEVSAFNLGGVAYYGWFTTGPFKSWESRYTLGGHCQAIRGVAGVRDESAEGSSALVRLLADDVPVYTSPTLTPGTPQAFQVALATPYRLAVQAQNTSATPKSVYPAVVRPELLCTGLA
jgi:hypothetical protein